VTPGVPDEMKQYYLAAEVGHYGIFNGSRWRGRIAPVVEAWMARFNTRDDAAQGSGSSGQGKPRGGGKLSAVN
jgi:poly(3-hydroxybutyrate) depolymerase